tara:strand:- start:3085 stop:3579 length:495 start_codon:yes stop_codon:yes gene_type:complete
MALWGNKDTVYSTGTVTSVDAAGVVTGNGTTWNSGNNVVPGLVITLGTGNGSGVIKSVDSTTQLTLVSTAGVLGTVNAGTAYNISEQPVYLPEDSNYSGNEVYGIDNTEVGVAQTTAYGGVAHSGWVGVTTYIDTHGKLRVKSEVLVASSSITADADDDARFAE